MSKENADLKSKVDVLEKKLNKSSKKFQKIKIYSNSFKKIIIESKDLLKTINKNNESKKDEDDELIKKIKC